MTAAALLRWHAPGPRADIEAAIEAAIDRGDHDTAQAWIAALDESDGDCEMEDDE